MRKIAIIGGGPSGLFVLKRLVEAKVKNIKIDVFEKKSELGSGMPYSRDGASEEHITNVSGNEIPELMTSLSEWIQTLEPEYLQRFEMNADNFNEYKVLPRLLFGQYLSEQFRLLKLKASELSIPLKIHRSTIVIDIIDETINNYVKVITDKEKSFSFDYAIICTGHHWPKIHEGKINGYFDSPYPPSKLALKINHPVAIRGASLSAVDAVRTLARQNGIFEPGQDGKTSFKLHKESNGFKMVLHSRRGLLPAVRFHLEDSHLGKGSILSNEEIEKNKLLNDGFLSLDFVFEKNFKEPLKAGDPEFYAKIEEMDMEDFVHFIMELRESVDAFDLFKGEYIEAEKSIQRKESVYWKEMLGVLSFVMNHPAKYFSAEDTMRLHKTLQPLLALVIAYVPQSSVEEMLALHQDGLLEFISVGDDSYVEPVNEGGAVYYYSNDSNKKMSTQYQTYIDAVGQPHFRYHELPFKSLLGQKTISSAKIKFKDPKIALKEKAAGNKNVIIDENGYYLNVPGIAINDNFQVLDDYGAYNNRIYMLAVPYIGGFNPDYSGLDFCEAASKYVVESLLKDI
jgi:hypothetical protein